MRCFGYYFVEPLETPEWSTLRSTHILSVSYNGLSEIHPILENCFWENYPQSNREMYYKKLGFSKKEGIEFSELVNDLFNAERLTTDVRFCSLQDALKMSVFLKNIVCLRLVGLFAEEEIFLEFFREGYFKTVSCGDDQTLGKFLGLEILGSESWGGGYFGFESYLINSLNEEISLYKNLIIDDKLGIILNSYKETEQFCDFIQGMGEDVVWTPFALYDYSTTI